jgi:hypothetical protein
VPKYFVETVTVAELVVAWLLQFIILAVWLSILVWLLTLATAE